MRNDSGNMNGPMENPDTMNRRPRRGVGLICFDHMRVLQRPCGYTLIEILVAVSIMAIALVGILKLFSGGLKSSALSDEYARGILHAREVMEELLLSERISEGKLTGEFKDGYKWKAEIRRYESAAKQQRRATFDALEINLSVMWDSLGKEKRFDLNTIRVAKNSEPSG